MQKGLPMAAREFLNKVQNYVAKVAITASSLRNQGAQGVVKKAREYLGKLNLNELKYLPPTQYPRWIEEKTQELLKQFPNPARKWGVARKALNVFLCHAYLNRYLCDEYLLKRLGDVMETPLDSIAAKRLLEETEGQGLPNWKTIRELKPMDSNEYQKVAERNVSMGLRQLRYEISVAR
jgi:hypothetical protein